MMSIKHYGFVALACLTLGTSYTSCSKDNDNIFDPKTEVQAPYTGERISLDLAGEAQLLGSDKLQAMDYKLEGEKKLPKLDLPAAGETVKVLTIFRRLGAPETTTYAELDWTVIENAQTKKKSIEYKGTVTLASGKFLKQEQGQWYMMALIGGTASNTKAGENPSQARVSYTAENLHAPIGQALQDVDVPYLLGWTPVNISNDGYGKNKDLIFKPQGSLARIEVRNGMVDDYKVKSLRVASNAFCSAGYFDIAKTSITDEHLRGNQTIVWKPKEEGKSYTLPKNNYFDTASRGLWSADTWAEASGLNLSSTTGKTHYTSYTMPEEQIVGSGQVSAAYYAWIMPTDIAANQAKSDFYLETGMLGSTTMLEALPALSSTQKFVSGTYYRIFPEITSDLIISEVAVHYEGHDRRHTVNKPAITDENGFESSVAVTERLYERVGLTRRSGGTRSFLRSASGDGWDNDSDANLPPPTEDLGAQSGYPNYSLIELYNPTLDTINLINYAIVRTTAVDVTKASGVKFRVFGQEDGVDNPMQATILPLKALATTSAPYDVYRDTPFPSWIGKRGNYSMKPGAGNTRGTVPPRHKVLAGTAPNMQNGQLLLYPGKTVILAGAGFLNSGDAPYNHWMPQDDAEYRDKIIVAIQKAVEKGYCQYAIAFSDGAPSDTGDQSFEQQIHKGSKETGYSLNTQVGTLELSNAVGIALIKFSPSSKVASPSNGVALIRAEPRFRIVDISVPFAPAYSGASQFNSDWQDFQARYTFKTTDGSTPPNAPIDYWSRGYARNADNNHTGIRPNAPNIPYTTIWHIVVSERGAAYGVVGGDTAGTYSYGTRDTNVPVDTPFATPALRPWVRKTK